MLQPVVAEIVSAQGRIISCQGVSVMNPDNNGSSSFFSLSNTFAAEEAVSWQRC